MQVKQQIVFDEVAAEMYENAAEHGFHPDEQVGQVTLERLAKFVANLHGETSELWEAGRRGTLHDRCDKAGCLLTNLEEELADIIIRALDTAHAYGISIGAAIRAKHEYNKSRPFMHGKKA